MADDGSGLVADLAGADRLPNPGQLLELLTDAEPVRGRGTGNAACRSDPAIWRLAFDEVITPPHAIA